MTRTEIGNHLMIDADYAFGKLAFKDTRIPVRVILANIAAGMSVEDAARGWPDVSRAAIEEAIQLAMEALHEKYAPLIDVARDESRERMDRVLSS